MLDIKECLNIIPSEEFLSLLTQEKFAKWEKKWKEDLPNEIIENKDGIKTLRKTNQSIQKSFALYEMAGYNVDEAIELYKKGIMAEDVIQAQYELKEDSRAVAFIRRKMLKMRNESPKKTLIKGGKLFSKKFKVNRT